MSFDTAINLPQKLDLNNEEFQRAYELLRTTNVNVFLTGKAGTGKSTFLSYLCRNLEKNYVVLAPTGVSAVNVGGVTIHSFFQMPLRPVPPDDPDYSVRSFKESKKISRRKRKLIQELDLIVIDEVSMVRADMIDFIDRALRGIRGKRGIAFGGVQLLLVGDIFQLEPVVTSDTKNILSRYYEDFFFFNARAYREAKLISVELHKIYRQTDSRFISLLDRIRINDIRNEDLDLLNTRVDAGAVHAKGSKFEIILAARRDAATAINSEKMESLKHREYVFEGIVEDDFPEKILPTDLNLVLKEGAQVMLIRNDREKRWVNGSLARIRTIRDNEIRVELEDGKEVTVEKEVWENINYYYDDKEKKVKEEILGRFTQYPLKAAWALTIHKSQGLTFGNVTIDMGGGAFSAGQTYVALSRCRSLDGLRFINPLKRYDIIVSKGAAEFSKNFNDKNAADMALRESRAHKLSLDAISDFNEGRFRDAVDKFWEVDSLVSSFSKIGVRRLLSGMLHRITVLRKKVEKQGRLLEKLSDEYVEMGHMSVAENIETAKANFEKAAKINPGNAKAELGLALCMGKENKYRKAYKILDKIIKGRGKCHYEALMLKGDILVQEANYSSAALNYQAAAKCRSKDKEPIERLVSVYEKAGFEELADQWRKWLGEM